MSVAKFCILIRERMLLIANFLFVAENLMQFLYWSSKLSLEMHQIFAQNFKENLQRRREKFTHFTCLTFEQYCIGHWSVCTQGRNLWLIHLFQVTQCNCNVIFEAIWTVQKVPNRKHILMLTIKWKDTETWLRILSFVTAELPLIYKLP